MFVLDSFMEGRLVAVLGLKFLPKYGILFTIVGGEFSLIVDCLEALSACC